MNKETIKNALKKIGVEDESKQEGFFAAFEEKNLREIGDKNIVAELEKLGVTEEKAIADFFAAVNEPGIMEQELDLEELEAVSGGDCSIRYQEEDFYKCVKDHFRYYLEDGCATTVIDSSYYNAYFSMCENNDSCTVWAVVYEDLGGYEYTGR